ncbi:MAG: chloride channel protein [Phycisphaerales bacterium]|jgi:CIC family chloride channel protein
MADSAASPGFLPTLAKRLRLKREWYVVAMGAVVGTLTGLGTLGFAEALHYAEKQVRHAQIELPIWLLFLGPVVGMALTGVLVRLFASDARGHGVPQVMRALIEKGGHIPARVGLTKVAASIATVASGGSAGTEGPIVQIGATAGSVVGQRLGVGREQMMTLVGCGAAAGISAIFNAPIAGVFFALEILLRDFSLKTFTPIVVSAVFAAAVTHMAQGQNEAIFTVSTFENLNFTALELPNYIVLGLICGLLAVGFNRGLHACEDLYARLKLHWFVAPITGGLILGVLGVAWILMVRAAGGDPASEATDIPSFFGNGYETIRWLLEPTSYGAAPEVVDAASQVGEHATAHDAHASAALPMAIWLIGLLVVFKALATSVTLSSGGSGGVFAPSLFIGAAGGAALGITLERVGLLPADSSPAAYALVGMAAVVAGSTHGPLTAILMLFELTRDPYVLLPIMLAAVVSTLLAQAIDRDNIYTHPLRRAGLRIGRTGDLAILRKISATSVPVVPLPGEPVYASDPLSKIITLHAHSRVPDFVVVDSQGDYIGMVTGRDMRTALIDREAIPLLLVAELMRSDLPAVLTTDTLDVVLERFEDDDIASLPLLGPPDLTGHRRPLGLVTRAAVLERYRRALEEEL